MFVTVMLMYDVKCLHYVAPNKVWIDGSTFLEGLGRGIKVTRGDGNCLFRSLSIIVCGNEDNHQFIRRILATFCIHNKELFQRFCHPTPITEHINGMKLDRIWGTDLEIHAAASLWQVNIYVCQPNTSDSSYSWICFKPFSPAELVCPDECQQLPHPPGVLHFELFYASRCHYDVIIGAHGYLPDNPPNMPELEEAYITLL